MGSCQFRLNKSVKITLLGLPNLLLTQLVPVPHSRTFPYGRLDIPTRWYDYSLTWLDLELTSRWHDLALISLHLAALHLDVMVWGYPASQLMQRTCSGAAACFA